MYGVGVYDLFAHSGDQQRNGQMNERTNKQTKINVHKLKTLV